MCKRPLIKISAILKYGDGDTLEFCTTRCRRDYLDKLPPGSIIKASAPERHKLDMVPWGLKDMEEGEI